LIIIIGEKSILKKKIGTDVVELTVWVLKGVFFTILFKKN